METAPFIPSPSDIKYDIHGPKITALASTLILLENPEVFFNIHDINKAINPPIRKLPQKIIIKRLISEKKLESRFKDCFISIIVRYKEIVIAPLNRLSPNIILYKDLSISLNFITGKIENGSVEETIIPKAKHSTREKFQEVISK